MTTRRHIPTLKERCLKGAALLDAKFPTWRARIDVSRLVMQQVHNDVLDQLYGDKTTAREQLGITEIEMGKYGFEAVDWEELTDFWRAITLDIPLPSGNIGYAFGYQRRYYED